MRINLDFVSNCIPKVCKLCNSSLLSLHEFAVIATNNIKLEMANPQGDVKGPGYTVTNETAIGHSFQNDSRHQSK